MRWSRLRTVHLRFTDEISARRDRLANLNGLAIVHANVAFRLPLTLILVKTIEIPGCIVQKHARRRQVV